MVNVLFAIQCHRFNYRLYLQLLSISQQIGYKPDIHIGTSGIGSPHFDLIYDEFKDKLNIYVKRYDIKSETFRKRGLLRNEQLKFAIDNKYEYIYFADCDIIYPDTFFQSLYVRKDQIKCCSYYLPKIHTEVIDTNRYIDEFFTNNAVDRNRDIYRKISTIKQTDKKNKKVAAGNMQVSSIQEIIEKTRGIYVVENENRDRDFLKDGQKARSDLQFRKAMGGSIHIDLKCPAPLHLNHFRDKEVGSHIEEDR